MAFTLTFPTAQNGVFDRVVNALQKFVRKQAEHRAYRTTRRELMALSDYNLADLGLTRAEIDRAALEAAIGFAHP